MIRGLYTSGWSMMANSKKMDVISNNMANINTNGYKKDTVVFESFPNVLAKRINDTLSKVNPSGNVGQMQMGNDVGEIFTYYSQGNMASTGSKLDMAIKEDASAFFTVGIPDEEGNLNEYYTRDGAFEINAYGQLTTKEGYYVMGENGPITLYSENFTVESDGTIVEDGIVVDRLSIKSFTDTSTLRKFGMNLVEKTDESVEGNLSGKVIQGFIEQSNVNIVREMVDMITVMRAYEANQKIIQAQDGTLEKVVNEVGVIR